MERKYKISTKKGIYMNKKIQILRAFAIIAVVMIHTNAGGYIGVLVRPFINFAVAMFIFLSGFLTKLYINDLKGFYKKRIFKVLIPYIIWSIIFTFASGNYNEFLNKILTANCCSIYYYIFVYIQLVLITPFVSKLIQSKYRWIGWCITPIAIFIIRYAVNFFNIPVKFPWNAANFLVWFIYYYMGMLLGNHKIEYKLCFRNTTLIYMLAIILSEVEGVIWYLFGNYDMATTQLRFTSILTSITAILLSYIFISSEMFVLKENKIYSVLLLIGNCSFGIYLSHILLMKVLTKIPGYGMLHFPITSLIVILISTLCVLIGKKMLGHKLSWILGL